MCVCAIFSNQFYLFIIRPVTLVGYWFLLLLLLITIVERNIILSWDFPTLPTFFSCCCRHLKAIYWSGNLCSIGRSLNKMSNCWNNKKRKNPTPHPHTLNTETSLLLAFASTFCFSFFLSFFFCFSPMIDFIFIHGRLSTYIKSHHHSYFMNFMTVCYTYEKKKTWVSICMWFYGGEEGCLALIIYSKECVCHTSFDLPIVLFFGLWIFLKVTMTDILFTFRR